MNPVARDRGRFYVYVVELRALDPRSVRSKPDVYVGSSALVPESRFGKHLSGARSGSGHVRRRGVRLRPDLYAGENPLPTREAAKAAEMRLRLRLEKLGHRVYGSCSPRTTDCLLD